MERRTGPRQRTIYRPAFVQTEEAVDFVVMRNISPEGACFTGSKDFPIGKRLTYLVADDEPIEAEVVWKDYDTFGVKNCACLNINKSDPPKPYRSVRLPLNYQVRAYVDGFGVESTLLNLSQRGACIDCPEMLSPGQLITLKIGKLSIAAAAVAWSNQGKAGIRFPQALDRKTVSQILRQIQQADKEQNKGRMQDASNSHMDRSTPGSRPVAIAS